MLGILGIGQAAQKKRPFIRNSCMVAKSAYALFSHLFINSFITSMQPFVYIYQCGSHWVAFCEIWYWCSLLRKSKGSENTAKISGTSQEDFSMFYCCQWHYPTPPPSSSSSSNPYFSFSSSFLHAQEILLPTIQNSGWPLTCLAHGSKNYSTAAAIRKVTLVTWPMPAYLQIVIIR